MLSGLWELLFPVRLSHGLKRFLAAFRPDIIYSQGYTLGFSQLPLMLHAWTGAPICFHTSDDWPVYLYSESPARVLLRPW